MTKTGRETFIAISAIGTDRPGLVNDLAKVVADHQCNIIDSRMTVLGGEFALVMLVSGNWDSVAKLETAIQGTASRLDLTTIVKRTNPRETKPAIAYSVNVVALDNPGIVHEIANFFYSRNMNIEDLHTGTYSAPHTGTTMFNMTMVVRIPPRTHLPSLREEFMIFCDDRNLDAMIEPVRAP